jgi:tRNA threonylcarbamoyl adenosine modification protein YjeE
MRFSRGGGEALAKSPEAVFVSPAALKEAAGLLALSLEEEGRLGRPLIIALEGPLGSGKTTFAQGFGRALGVDPGEITSPTFTLANTHQGRAAFSHLDLYRLEARGSPLSEFMEAGLDEFLGGVALIEWPDRLDDNFWPEDRIRVILREYFPAAGADGKPLSGSPAQRAGRFLGPVPESFWGRMSGFPVVDGPA